MFAMNQAQKAAMLNELSEVLDSKVSMRLRKEWCSWAKRWWRRKGKRSTTVREFVTEYLFHLQRADGAGSRNSWIVVRSIELAAGLRQGHFGSLPHVVDLPHWWHIDFSPELPLVLDEWLEV